MLWWTGRIGFGRCLGRGTTVGVIGVTDWVGYNSAFGLKCVWITTITLPSHPLRVRRLWHVYQLLANARTYIRYDRLRRTRVPVVNCFNPRTYIRYDGKLPRWSARLPCFNPRTYIRYDSFPSAKYCSCLKFQSTYLYKVRLPDVITGWLLLCFNPRTYIRYDTVSYSFDFR